MSRRPSAVPAKAMAAACLIAVAIGGCASSTTNHTFDASDISSPAPSHGPLTDAEFNVAVAVARAETEKYSATVTSATATVGVGTVTDPNVGPPCTSGTLLHIKLIGTFPTIGVSGPSTGAPSSNAPSDGSDRSVTTVLITADPASGQACELSVRIDQATPDPGATLLFTK